MKLLKSRNKIKECLDPLLKNKIIDKNTYNHLLPKGSQPGKMYGLCKVHKTSSEVSPPFYPILSAIGTPTYNLANFLIPILEPLTKNHFVIKDSFLLWKMSKSSRVSYSWLPLTSRHCLLTYHSTKKFVSKNYTSVVT